MNVPSSTYRLQFREGMDFARAASLVPYWRGLRMGALYASPVFRATAGSTHGYDVVDHGALDPVLGGREGFDAMSDALREAGMGLVLDIVPNHMAASLQNPWYRDVLRHGEGSRYARHFDIDWTAPKLLVTTLGRPYGEVLRNGEFGLARLSDGPAFTVYDKAIPLDPATWELVFDDPDLPTLPSAPHAEARTEWFERFDARERAALDGHLERLAADEERVHAIHEAQPWRLTYWRAARDTLTHRRFFEITDLIGVRVEDEAVWEDVHRLVLDLVREKRVTGLRVDHVDGLADPGGYLERLRERLDESGGKDVPVWVEKILGPGELLPETWPVAGTTGYEAATWIAGALSDPAGEAPLTEAYDRFTEGEHGGAGHGGVGHGGARHGGVGHDYDAMLDEAKREIVTRNLAAELRLLTNIAHRIAARDPDARDYGIDTLRRAILSLASAMRVYRTYLHSEGADRRDRAIIDRIEREAVASFEVEDAGAVGFVASLLRDAPAAHEAEHHGPGVPDLDEAARAVADHKLFRRRFQQTTGALMAKALEDTLFYRYHRLVALNEVGGEPDTFALAPDAFHHEVEARAANQPDGMVTTATHDTKRGADARMRQLAIAHHARHWTGCVARWDAELTALVDDPPEAEMRWLFFQALLGAWEGTAANLRERLQTFLVKAARESKGETSWVRTDEDYESRLEGFVAAALPDGDTDFLDRFVADCRPVIDTGDRLSLAQAALHLTLPGVPDVYQGTEGGDFSLVDPDNRRPPHWDDLAGMLEADRAPAEARTFGERKFALVSRLLALRAEAPDLFRGAYEPVENGDLVAFRRKGGGRELLVAVAPRGAGRLAVDGEWTDVMTGESATAARVQVDPVTALVRPATG